VAGLSAAHAGIHVVDLGGPLLALGGGGSAENQFLAMYKRALSDTHDQTLPRLAGTVALKLRGSFLVNKRIRVTAFGAPADCLVTQFRQRENKDEYKLVWDVPDDEAQASPAHCDACLRSAGLATRPDEYAVGKINESDTCGSSCGTWEFLSLDEYAML